MKISIGIKWLTIGIVMFSSLIIPMVLLESPLAQYGEKVLLWSKDNYFLISLVVIFALTADVFLPVPNGLTNTLAGATLGWTLASFVVWIGLNLGAIFGYLIGRFAARPLVIKLIGKNNLLKSEGLSKEFSTFGLIISRPIPAVAEIITLAAGVSKVPFTKFCFVVGVTNIGVAIVFSGLGAAALASNSASLAFLGAVFLPLILYFMYRKFF